MKKLVVWASAVILSFGFGIFVGHRLQAHQANSPTVYQDVAVNVASALQDEKFLAELTSFAGEAKNNTKKFLFAIVKNLPLSEKEFADIKTCIENYQELTDMFDGVNIELVQQAWQSVAWEIIDGRIAINETSLNTAAKKLAGQDGAIAPRIKKFAALNTQWGPFIENMSNVICQMRLKNGSSFIFDYINFNTSMYKMLKKYPRVQDLLYQIHACLQFQHTKQLFLLALKDELINSMPQWLPKTWPHAKEGMQELGEILDAIITRHIKYLEQHKNEAVEQKQDENEQADEEEAPVESAA